MAVPACFHLADDVFPRVRAAAARRFLAQGWSQARTAAVLHVSQAMVSKYAARQDDESDPLVLRLVDELVAAEGPATGPSAWCDLLSIQEDRPGMGEALQDLLAAERSLLAAQPVHIVPEVGLNLARAVAEPQGPQDVLAYPARIVSAGDQVVAPVAPALGASNHLAACLLALRSRDDSIQAIANIRGGSAVRQAAKGAVELQGEGDRIALFQAAVAAADHTPTLVHDLGGIGIEPCLYIAGPTATAVVDRILTIAQVTP